MMKWSIAESDTLQKILVPTDFSACSSKAFSLALALAREWEAEVHLMHVVVPLEGSAHSLLRFTPEASVLHESPDKLIYDQMTAMIAAHDTAGIRVEIVKPHASWIVPALLDYVQKEGIDLIVLGTHGKTGLKQLFLGSITKEIVSKSPCDMLFVHEQAEDKPTLAEIRRILVPIDFSIPAKVVMARAKNLAAAYGARIDLLHVVESPSFLNPVTGLTTIGDLVPDISRSSETYMNRLFESVEGPKVSFEIHIEEGSPVIQIVEFAKKHEIDLIVMGTRGETGLRHFLFGSVAERVARTAECLVYTVDVGHEATDTLEPSLERSHAGPHPSH